MNFDDFKKNVEQKLNDDDVDDILTLGIRRKNGDIDVYDVKLSDIKCIIKVNDDTYYIQTTENYFGPLKKLDFSHGDLQGLIKYGVKVL